MSTQLWQSGDNVVCGEGWTQLEDGDAAGDPGAAATLSPRRGPWVSWECPGLGSKDSLRSTVCEGFFLLFFRCLLSCMVSPKTLTLFRSGAMAMAGR